MFILSTINLNNVSDFSVILEKKGNGLPSFRKSKCTPALEPKLNAWKICKAQIKLNKA